MANRSTDFGWILKADTEAVVTTGSGATGQNTVTAPGTARLMEGTAIANTGISSGVKIAPCGINTATNTLTLTAANIGTVSGDLVFASPSGKRFLTKTAVLVRSRPKLILNYAAAPPTLPVVAQGNSRALSQDNTLTTIMTPTVTASLMGSSTHGLPAARS